MFAIEGFLQGQDDWRILDIFEKHRRPGYRLKHCPMPANPADQQANQQTFRKGAQHVPRSLSRTACYPQARIVYHGGQAVLAFNLKCFGQHRQIAAVDLPGQPLNFPAQCGDFVLQILDGFRARHLRVLTLRISLEEMARQRGCDIGKDRERI